MLIFYLCIFGIFMYHYLLIAGDFAAHLTLLNNFYLREAYGSGSVSVMALEFVRSLQGIMKSSLLMPTESESQQSIEVAQLVSLNGESLCNKPRWICRSLLGCLRGYSNLQKFMVPVIL